MTLLRWPVDTGLDSHRTGRDGVIGKRLIPSSGQIRADNDDDDDVKSLETLSVERNYATRKSAYQLHSAVTKLVFIVALQTKAKYSAVLEAKSIDMISVGEHIKNIKDILINYRVFPDRISKEMLQKARAVAMD